MNNQEFTTQDFKLTLRLHNGSQDDLKNSIENDTLYNYLLTNHLISPNFNFNNNVVISTNFIMIDLRSLKFMYNGCIYTDSFKDAFVNNKFYKNGDFPIFFLQDIHIRNLYEFNYINTKLTDMATEIITNLI